MTSNTSSLFLHGIFLKPEIPDSDYPFSIPAVSHLNIKLTKPVTFLVGENGSGKSTILEALADRIGFNSMGEQNNINSLKNMKRN